MNSKSDYTVDDKITASHDQKMQLLSLKQDWMLLICLCTLRYS